jgi:hypothetical protein
MISERVQKEIDSARNFGEQLEEVVVSKNQLPNRDQRDVLLIGYWGTMFDFHKGILLLLQSEFSGSAFALVRPVVEANIRAHITIIGRPEDLEKLANDEYRTNFNSVGKQIDDAFVLEGLMETLLNNSKEALHGYTHVGLLQLGRRFKGDDVAPNYSDDEIVEVIRTTSSAMFMISNLVTKHFGFDEDWKKVGDLFAEWGKH